MGISDWSSDVCSSDLLQIFAEAFQTPMVAVANRWPIFVPRAAPITFWKKVCSFDRSLCDVRSLRRHRRSRPSDALPVTSSEEHTSELQSLIRLSYADICLNKKIKSHNPLLKRH